MTIPAAKDGQLVKAAPPQAALAHAEPPKTLMELVSAMSKQIAMVLPKHVTPERMTRLAMSALRTTRDLDKCSLPSFGAALMACSALGLEPNTPLGQAYLIPFKKNTQVNGHWESTTECQVIIGYQGMLDLMRRSGQVASVQAFAVYQGDEFEYELGLSPTLRHKPSESADRENGLLTHAYCVVRLKDKDADPVFLVMPRAQIEKRRMRGASGKKDRNGKQFATPWDTDYEAMALKTVTRATAKWAPRSTEVSIAIAVDERSEANRSIVPALPAEAHSGLLLTAGYEPDTEENEDTEAAPAEAKSQPKPEPTDPEDFDR
jgi:recombination protein RecT